MATNKIKTPSLRRARNHVLCFSSGDGTNALHTYIHTSASLHFLDKPPSHAFFSCSYIRCWDGHASAQAVEAALHSTRGLQGRDQRLQEWKSKAYGLSNAEARALSARLLDGKQASCAGMFFCAGRWALVCSQHMHEGLR